MIQIIIQLEGINNIKEKRRVVQSLKKKLENRFHLSAAEVDLQDSLSFAQVGAALVSNSKGFGEMVLQKAFKMVEDEMPVRIADVSIYSQDF